MSVTNISIGMPDTGGIDNDTNSKASKVEMISTLSKDGINEASTTSEEIQLLTDTERDSVAFDVLSGKYSNGEERRQKLKSSGYDYENIQSRVNELVPIYLAAKDVLSGKYSNGDERKQRLTAAGYDAEQVQTMVNRILGIDQVEVDSTNSDDSSGDVSSSSVNLESENLKEEQIEQRKLEKQVAIKENTDTLAGIVNRVDGAFGSINSAFEKNQRLNQEKITNFSSALSKKAFDEYINRNNSGSYRKGNWCANFATWIWANTIVDGKSAFDIARLSNGKEINIDKLPTENFTSSTGKLMMHFLTASHPDLYSEYPELEYLKDYSGYDFYDPEVNNNIAFYYNDHLKGFAGKNSANLPNGVKNYDPKPGDFVFFDIDGKGDEWVPIVDPNQRNATQDHTGLVQEVIKNNSGEVIGIKTIEGNIKGVGYYMRTIYFENAGSYYDPNDKYATGLIGYGTIKNVP